MASSFAFSHSYRLNMGAYGVFTVAQDDVDPSLPADGGAGVSQDGDPLDGRTESAMAGDAVSTSTSNGTVEEYYTGFQTSGGGMIVTAVDPVSGEHQYWLNTSEVYAANAALSVQTADWNFVCFLAGTLIATPSGERPIETLAPGDLITLANGEPRPVRWVGRQTKPLHAWDRGGAGPVLIRAGALGDGLPRRDLYTTYDHAFALEGVLVIAGVLVNGTSIVHYRDWTEPALTVYQLDVGSHELLLAEGAAAETFAADDQTRMRFDNAEEFFLRYPGAERPEPMPLGRVLMARQLPARVRERVARAAADIGLSRRVA